MTAAMSNMADGSNRSTAERCAAEAFSSIIRWYSARVQVPDAIIQVRCAMVSHDASVSSVSIRGSGTGVGVFFAIAPRWRGPRAAARAPSRDRLRYACIAESAGSGLVASPIRRAGSGQDGGTAASVFEELLIVPLITQRAKPWAETVVLQFLVLVGRKDVPSQCPDGRRWRMRNHLRQLQEPVNRERLSEVTSKSEPEKSL